MSNENKGERIWISSMSPALVSNSGSFTGAQGIGNLNIGLTLRTADWPQRDILEVGYALPLTPELEAIRTRADQVTANRRLSKRQATWVMHHALTGINQAIAKADGIPGDDELTECGKFIEP